jgi:hypothetical protein
MEMLGLKILQSIAALALLLLVIGFIWMRSEN